MVNQKAMTFFGVEVPDSLAGSLSELGTDMMTLAELQARLAKADLDETIQEARWSAIGLGIGLVVLLACVPIALVGLAELIVLAGWMPRGGAYLAVAGVAALLAGLTAWLCVRHLTRCGSAFRRSKEEFDRNVGWIVKVVSEGGSLRLRQPPRARW